MFHLVTRSISASLIGIVLVVGNLGCAFGPMAIQRTHGKYSEAVQRVEEEEFLKNIVRLRYIEVPRNLEVTSIAAQYEISAGAEARPFFSTEAVSSPSEFRGLSSILPFASLAGSSRPTISLTPQDDGSSVRQFLTPISADTITFLVQSGWPVANVMRIWLDRINGVPNWVQPNGPPRDRPSDFMRFRRATELLQVAQDKEMAALFTEERTKEMSGPIPAEAITPAAAVEAAKAGFEFRPRPDGKAWSLIRRERNVVIKLNTPGRGSAEIAELASILNLRADSERFEFVVASGVPDPLANPTAPVDVLRLTPRSTEEAMFYLANAVEIPPEHVKCGLVQMPADGSDPSEATRGVFAIHQCAGHRHKRPPCAYVSVWYRDHWYYIDDRDAASKSTLLLMLQLRQLDFKRQEIGRVPALTLPVGR